MSQPICQLSDLAKSYRDHTVITSLSFNVDDGEMVSIVGPSGCGKSTVLNILGLLEPFDSGEYRIFGRSSPNPGSGGARRLLRNSIGYLFQNSALIDNESVTYNLELAQAYVAGRRGVKRRLRAEALESVGLAGFEKRRVFELSGGEQQRLAIARLLLKPCQLVLADEPTGSLDPENRDVVLDLLLQLCRSGKTVVLVTHDPAVAARCNRVVSLDHAEAGAPAASL